MSVSNVCFCSFFCGVCAARSDFMVIPNDFYLLCPLLRLLFILLSYDMYDLFGMLTYEFYESFLVTTTVSSVSSVLSVSLLGDYFPPTVERDISNSPQDGL